MTVVWVCVALVVGFVLSGPAVSCAWHILHGNEVAFDGHKLHLPMMWRTQDQNAGKLRLSRAMYGTLVTHHLVIYSQQAADKAGEVADGSFSNSASRLALGKKLEIRGAGTNYSCVLEDDRYYDQQEFRPSTLTCMADKLNWLAIFHGATEYVREAKSILASAH